MHSRWLGAAGEVIASRYLREHGYQIRTANERSHFGEIDIIAENKSYIVFVEVKTRSRSSLYLPREAVTKEKQKRIILTALLYLKRHKTKKQPRFDVIEIMMSEQLMKPEKVEHIIDAFDAGGFV